MEQQAESQPDVNKVLWLQKKLSLESSYRNSVNWFYWIGALSIFNSIIYLLGGSITFVVGLGITQFIDGIVSVLAEEFVSDATILHLIGIFLDLLVAGIFIGFGVLGRKRHRWAVITGLVLYILDAILVIIFKDWLGFIFHGLAILGLITALQYLKKLQALEQTNSLMGTPMISRVPGSTWGEPTKPYMTLKIILIISGILLAIVAVAVMNMK